MKQKMRPTQHKRASRTIKCFLAVALALTMLIGLSTTAYAGVTEPKISNSKTYTETENGVAWTFISGKSNQGNALLRLTNIKTFFFIKFFPAKATITEFTVWFKLLGIRILSKSTNTIDYKSAGNRIAADEIAAQTGDNKCKVFRIIRASIGISRAARATAMNI